MLRSATAQLFVQRTETARGRNQDSHKEAVLLAVLRAEVVRIVHRAADRGAALDLDSRRADHLVVILQPRQGMTVSPGCECFCIATEASSAGRALAVAT